MQTTAQIQGQRGALYGLAVECEFARRCGGCVSSAMKIDVVDREGRGHSVKNTRRTKSVRLLAKSYSTIPDQWGPMRAYASARAAGDKTEELAACAEILRVLRDPERARALWTVVVTGGEPSLQYFTVYDNRTEAATEDLSGSFRVFRVMDIIDRLTGALVWEVSSRKHCTVRARMPGRRPLVATISLGSPKRKLLLFSLCNVHSWLDACEAAGLERVPFPTPIQPRAPL